MNVSSVKNLNGGTFSAVQDATLTDVVQTNSGNWQDITAYQSNSANYLTAHQAISAEEWNSNYDTVKTNSGAWGGSALPISAGPGIKVNLVDNTLVFSTDETVLYSGVEPTSAVSLTESWKNFDRLKIYVQNKSMDNGLNMVEVRPLERDGHTPYYNIIAGFSYGLGTNGMIWQNIIGSATDTVLTNCSAFGFQNSWTATSPTVRKNNANDLNCILKVIGINRISGGNA